MELSSVFFISVVRVAESRLAVLLHSRQYIAFRNVLHFVQVVKPLIGKVNKVLVCKLCGRGNRRVSVTVACIAGIVCNEALARILNPNKVT